ncbi:YihY/virulence factor BrkB family protein [Streptomyces sp. TRM66268-LWL]|uniref:YihY/virulence factor BrkB family protein n=1 Tax=Streptomyces polyasparticus TaxID=2767826 RepID=A0ABR7SNY6_9ACTN|nr:YihY/virulence factor BrkB family protein [Streptomyces polyasparticus]MBC9717195.1 YihY/virulence factor BrkB family protein [Streptomyces polyasparticus]
MDWLKKLPVVGPWVERLMATHAYRSYETLDQVHWARLAGAMTFVSFLALFPLLTVLAAIAAATLSKKQQDDLQEKISDQIPGISDQLNIGDLVENAGTVGLIAGALLLVTGVSWVGSIRECLRAVWGKDDEEANPVVAKLKDAGILVGLGLTGLASLAASAVGSTAAVWLTRAVGIEDQSWIGWLLLAVVFALAVLADFLILLYVLTLLPGVQPPRRRLFVAALIGAVGFELLKLLLGGYMKGVAAKSMYGAFGVPVALLLWINFTAKLLLFCAAWTATQSKKGPDGPSLTGGEASAPSRAAASGG